MEQEDIDRRVKARKKWWTNVMWDAGLSNRALAALVDLDFGAVNRIINSKRSIKVEKAHKFAKALHVDLEAILRVAPALISEKRTEIKETKGTPYTKVVGWIDEDGNIVKFDRDAVIEKNVTRPARMDAEGVAMRIMDLSLRRGWLVYCEKVDYVHDKAVGNLCVVETVDKQKLLRFVQRTNKARRYELLTMDGKSTGIAELKTAAPVLWIKPDLK